MMGFAVAQPILRPCLDPESGNDKDHPQQDQANAGSNPLDVPSLRALRDLSLQIIVQSLPSPQEIPRHQREDSKKDETHSTKDHHRSPPLTQLLLDRCSRMPASVLIFAAPSR